MILWQLRNEGYSFSQQDLETLSPYMKRYITLLGLCD
ncbi:hypothetical protein PDN35_23565 [Bacillus cereus]|nr:hypothetical protein [Bacillus cereus]